MDKIVNGILVVLSAMIFCCQSVEGASIAWDRSIVYEQKSIEGDSYDIFYTITPFLPMDGYYTESGIRLVVFPEDNLVSSNTFVPMQVSDSVSREIIEGSSNCLKPYDELFLDYGESCYLGFLVLDGSPNNGAITGWVELHYGEDGKLYTPRSEWDFEGGLVKVGSRPQHENIPEPSTFVLLWIGLCMLGLRRIVCSTTSPV